MKSFFQSYEPNFLLSSFSMILCFRDSLFRIILYSLFIKRCYHHHHHLVYVIIYVYFYFTIVSKYIKDNEIIQNNNKKGRIYVYIFMQVCIIIYFSIDRFNIMCLQIQTKNIRICKSYPKESNLARHAIKHYLWSEYFSIQGGF